VSWLLLFLALAVPDGDPEAIWAQANRAYADGRFDDAIASYEVLLESGVHNGKLHFNLANAYMKEDQVGPAILHYLKARKYLPGDADVRANLALAEQARAELIEGEDEAFMAAYDSALRRLNYSTVFGMAAICLALAGLALAWRIVRPDTGKWLTYLLTIALVWGLIASTVTVMQYRQLTRDDLAVLVARVTEVRAGPARTETVSFTISEGARCRILDETEGWFRIGLANGYNGWVPQRSVSRI